ncbi:twin-arginine translocase subunit TatC [Tepidicaulis sp. LMO-SS28]|uniref:twin-arginine translocase subunit TatC n=1 Tax=Tepidicaulis sp. LMO-SS28 TaxID=3447455 RepID=UPI003EE0B382
MSKPEEDLDDLEASRAPLLDHLIELRTRLLYSVIAIAIAFGACFYFANDIYNILLVPYERAAGDTTELKVIFTAPQEYFFTQLKLALFGAFFLAFPILATQIYMFVAPGLYKNERYAFLPYLVATPVLFAAGAALVYFLIMPLALGFFLSMQQSAEEGKVAIELLPRVSEYLGLIMTLILAFGLCFQLPVALSLLGRAGLVTSKQLKSGRKYAIVAIFAFAAILTPPDIISQVGLGLPTLLLYEISILSVAMIERRRREAREEDDEERGPYEDEKTDL